MTHGQNIAEKEVALYKKSLYQKGNDIGITKHTMRKLSIKLY